MGAGFRDAGNSITGTTAEISVVAFWMNNPIVPANRREVDVERITTTFARTRPAIYISRLPAYRSLRKRVNHDEGFTVVMH